MKSYDIEDISVLEWLSICVDSTHPTWWITRSEEYKSGWIDAIDRVIDIELELYDWLEAMTIELKSKLIRLIEDWKIFVNYRDSHFVLAINCNDLFAISCADAEPIGLNEIEEFYSYCYDKNDEKIEYGSYVYTCLKRKEQPISEIKNKMVEFNLWTDELEGLEKNYYENAIR